jgi:hypothetical protein
VIGFSWMTPTVMLVTFIIGLASAIGAIICNTLEG